MRVEREGRGDRQRQMEEEEEAAAGNGHAAHTTFRAEEKEGKKP